MKLRTRLLSYTAALTLTAGAAFAAIDGNQLADDYLAQGYDFVEVKVGPTQTKVEAIKDGVKVEVIYDNETLAIIKQEQERADRDDATRTGKQVRTSNRDFADDSDDDGHRGRGGRDDDDEDDDDHRSGHDNDDDDHDDDHGGSGGGDRDDDNGGDDHGGDDD